MLSLLLKTLLSVIFWRIVLCEIESPGVRTLCEDTYIHSADRMTNNSYRVYRGNYYWELIGLPDKVATVRGPFDIWWKNMAPITRGTAIYTVVNGGIDGYTYKYKGERFWVWNKKGVQRAGGEVGYKWTGFPKGGFTAAFNDGDLDKKGYPMLIAFSGIRVYYFNTKGEVFRRVGNDSGHINGAYDEKFPPDLTAAMPFKSTDPDVKYYVYLFKRSQYCFRPIKGENGCKEWRDNKELFGCLSGDSKPEATDSNEPIPQKPKQPEEEKTTEKPNVSENEEEKEEDLDDSLYPMDHPAPPPPPPPAPAPAQQVETNNSLKVITFSSIQYPFIFSIIVFLKNLIQF